MTQNVDSKLWSASIRIQSMNFQNVIDPPARSSRDEFLTQIIRRFSDETTSVLASTDWLATDLDALQSVLKGLSQEGLVDRGSFSVYA
jgi:hypothetical protein